MNIAIIIALVITVGAAAYYWHSQRTATLPPSLAVGAALPDIALQTDDGAAVRPSDLYGKAAVIIFLRGSWCPFCNSQVKDLTRHYREINALDAELVFVTPKPLDTTRRVAEIFEVTFTFWVDPNLQFADAVGLKADDEVPDSLQQQFGPDTIRPASIVIDSDGVIRYAVVAEDVKARPEPERLVAELRKIKDQHDG